jgi:hypothetical protein
VLLSLELVEALVLVLQLLGMLPSCQGIHQEASLLLLSCVSAGRLMSTAINGVSVIFHSSAIDQAFSGVGQEPSNVARGMSVISSEIFTAAWFDDSESSF